MPVFSVFLYFCSLVAALRLLSQVLICRNVSKRLGEVQSKNYASVERSTYPAMPQKHAKTSLMSEVSTDHEVSDKLSQMYVVRKGLYGIFVEYLTCISLLVLWCESLGEVECMGKEIFG